MKKIFTLLFFTISIGSFAAEITLTSGAECGSFTTSYTDATNSFGTEDPIFVYNGSGTNGSLTCPAGGLGVTYDWYVYDELTNSYADYSLNAGTSISNLPSGGYLVVRTEGAQIDEGRAWIWNSTVSANAGSDVIFCGSTTTAIDGSGTSSSETFTYFDPVKRPAIIDATTIVNVRFDATHTWVSDLAFYLVTPATCGNQTVTLAPNQGSICNSGDDVSDLVFTNDVSAPGGFFDYCNLTTPLTGTFNGYHDGTTDILIDWSDVLGCNANSGGWKVQIYDCTSLDVGSLDGAEVTFDFGGGNTVTYQDNTINSAINDNSCDALSASVFEVPFVGATSVVQTDDMVSGAGASAPGGGFEWVSSTTSAAGPWGAVFNNTDLSPSVTPTQTTWYKLETSNDAGCSIEDVVEVSIETPVNSGVAVGSPVIICDNLVNFDLFDGLDGTENSGGTWTDDDGTGLLTASILDVSSLATGTYDFTYEVTAISPCTNESTTITIEVVQAQTLSVSASDLDCNGDSDGAVNLTVSGGVAAFNYDWDNDGMGDNDDNQDLSGLPAGTYNVTVTDANGCAVSTSASIGQPSALTTSIIGTDADCFGMATGAIDLTVSGGTASYLFDWDNDGTGDTDDSEDLGSIVAGTYNITVTDANGCLITDMISIGQASDIAITSSLTQVTCFGDASGAIDLNITGGNGGYTFDWDMDGTGDFDDTEDVSGLSAGTYNINILDVNGCEQDEAFTLTEGSEIVLSFATVDAGCFGAADGEIDLTVAGGAGGYSYDWDNDGTGDTDDSQDLTGLTAGAYDVTVIDGDGCSTSTTANVNSAGALDVTFVFDSLACYGDINAMIDMSINGGTGPFTIDWDIDGVGDNDDSEDLMNLSAGIYSVTVTDDNICIVSDQVVIFEPDEIELTLATVDLLCNGDGSGEAEVTVTGGIPNYSFNWDNDGLSDSDDTAIISNVDAGNYWVFVTDDNGCSDSLEAIINEPLPLELTADISHVLTADDGAIDLTIDGGTSPYTIDWDNDGTGDNDDSEDQNGLSNGVYTVTVADAHGCQETLTEIIDDASGISSVELGGLRVYPVPTNGNLNVEWSADSKGAMKIELADLNGRTIYFNQTSSSKLTIDMSRFERGSYLLIVKNDDFYSTRIISVQ